MKDVMTTYRGWLYIFCNGRIFYGFRVTNVDGHESDKQCQQNEGLLQLKHNIRDNSIMVNVFDFISVKGIKAIGNQLSKKQLKEINLLDPIPYEPEIKELNEIEVVDEQDDDSDDDSNENGQSQIKLEF